MGQPLPEDRSGRPVAVIGAGTLGRRIAMMFATRGGTVRIFDPSAEQRQAAVDYAAQALPATVRDLGLGPAGTVEASDDQARAVRDAWLVVEAVPEKLDLKRKVFGQLDAEAPEDAILASNSSSYASRLFIDEVARPERVLNTHFYMPPATNALDVMSCGKTEPSVIDFVKRVFPDYGLHPFEVRRESTGFIFNRIWAAIKRESLEVVYEGVSTPQDVDAMFKLNFGTKAGPFQMMDQVGLDVVLDIEDHYAAENPSLPEGPRKLLREYIGKGRLGVKSGAGFYDYAKDGKPQEAWGS
ncbi:3-hydroxyacyl-CoA dehydrogenase family protein [Actinomadura rupiterrae]|uniref:3-hydroxyacyl-CoA dehydrogenase family protein n=1 Tax=Actinomadura rupiterrae TaxID=559627 RepID=UPI0020A54D55|nr:3-hydroxyacyl-CoA dehydrogenase family protein [Actinomadura rupiterrae]MCP2339871.1 3-hydroxybutyryl-CoA dehydrogenase [Actinomadura rupiterrae]